MKSERLNLLLMASIILTIVCAIITYYAIQNSRERILWAFQTHATVSQAQLLLSLVKDMETAQRGYILTNDSMYLEPMSTAKDQVAHVVDSLSKLTKNTQQQATLHDNILPLIERRVEKLEQTLAFYNNQGQEAAINSIKTDQGKMIMDSLRNEITAFVNKENISLKQRIDEVNNTHKNQNLIRYISFAVIGGVSILAMIALIRFQQKNDTLIQQLNQANTSLESRIQERTTELSRKNAHNEELNKALQGSLDQLEAFYGSLQMRFEKSELASQEIRSLYDNPVCGHHSLNENGLIIRMNKTELSWLGYKAEEVLDKMYLSQMVHPSELESYRKDFATFKKTGFLVNKEHTFVRKDGTTFPVLINATLLLDDQGNYKMSRATVVDVSKQKLTEALLQEANKNLLHVNEEKNRFLSIAAHDMKSPLNGILGLTNLLRLSKSNLTTEQMEYIQYIEQSSRNMQNIITNLLDISRIEQGEHKLNPEMVEISKLLKRHIQVFHNQAQQKKITLILEDNFPQTKVYKDLSSLERIIENLLSNAIKFSPQEKTVVIRVIHTETHIGFEVVDQGQGIASEDMKNIFKKFNRLNTRPTGCESSTGLGLSIVKELVQALQGEIQVESKLNEGTRFAVTFSKHTALA